MPRNPTPVELEQMRDRFDASVKRGDSSECWPWLGSKCGGGYGRLTAFKVPFKVHRLALLYAGVDLPTDLLALHSCDNPTCCNPAHLRPGTQRDNCRDIKERKRGHDRFGEKNARALLDPERVRFVRRLLAHGYSAPDIAFIFGVATSTISAIRRGVNWRTCA